MQSKESGAEFVRLLNLGDEDTWREAFDALYPIAMKAARSLGLAHVTDLEEVAFEVLRGLPLKVGQSPLGSLRELKARTIASVYARGQILLDNVGRGESSPGGFSWAALFDENPREAEERMAHALMSLNEIMRERLTEHDKKLLTDRYVLKFDEEKMAADRGIEIETIRGLIRDAFKKLRDGLEDFGLGWLGGASV
jgi:hypothetical protein